MLQVFRESFGRYIAIAIMAFIGITFIFFGIDFTVTQLSYAAKVNGEAIPIQEYESSLQRRQNEYQQQFRAELSDDDLLAIRRLVLDEMVMREVLLQRAKEAGYRISDARVEQSIRDTEAFQIDGQYSEDVAQSLLRDNGLTVEGFRRNQREQLALVEFEEAVYESSFITPDEFRRYIEVYFEKREIGYATFAAASFADQVTIEDAEVAQFYSDNESQFQTEESVDVEFAVLDLASIAASTEVSEDELRSFYESEAERYAGSEERHVRHILIAAEGDDREAARAEATRVRERLDAGEDFAQLAAELSDDGGTRNNGGDLGWYVRGVLDDGPLDAALFAMTVGAVEGPVESEFGFHILRLDEVRAGAQPPFESVRAELRDDLATEKAATEFYDRATELAEVAFDAGSDLASIAGEFGLTLETMPGLTRSGAGDRFADPAPFVEAAFDENNLASGNVSDLIELDDSSVAVLRVAAHHPQTLRPLEEVSAGIRETLIRGRAGELAADAAAAFLAGLDSAAIAAGTQDPAALAAAQGASWTDRLSVERGSAAAPAPVISTVFAQARPAAGAVGIASAPLENGDEAVVLVYSALPGDPEDIPVGDRDQGQEQLAGQAAQAEINAFGSDARESARIRVPDQVLNPDL
jgi:peptidyl-prolyl cis-trans isomerase D